MIGLPVIAITVVLLGVYKLDIDTDSNAKTKLGDAFLNHLRAPDKNRGRNLLINNHLNGPQHALVLALGIDHSASLGRLGYRHNGLHEVTREVDKLLQPIAVGYEIIDGSCGHPVCHSGLGHRRRNFNNEPWVKRLRNKVIGAKAKTVCPVGSGHDVGLLSPCKLCNCIHRRKLHVASNGGCPYIKRPSKNKGKAQNIVHLVGIVGTAGCNDGVGPNRLRIIRKDFWIGIGQGKNKGACRHFLDHLGLQHTTGGKTKKDVRILNDLD